MVVCTTRESLRYFWPFIAQLFMGLRHDPFFFFSPHVLINVWIYSEKELLAQNESMYERKYLYQGDCAIFLDIAFHFGLACLP